MSIPNIDTFEHDISQEIKNKEATIGDIASAGGDVGNAPVRTSSLPNLLIALGILFFIVAVGVSVFFLMRYTSTPAVVPVTEGEPSTPEPSTISISPTIETAIGASFGRVTQSEYGYVIELRSYSDVFAYMIKNESAYVDEIASTVGSPRDTATDTPPFSFTDVTINNQNMRVGTSASSTVVYAFVNTDRLLISSSTESILTLRGAILR